MTKKFICIKCCVKNKTKCSNVFGVLQKAFNESAIKINVRMVQRVEVSRENEDDKIQSSVEVLLADFSLKILTTKPYG